VRAARCTLCALLRAKARASISRSAHRRRVALRIVCGVLTISAGLGAVAICVWQLVQERNFSGVRARRDA
jgi:hypothetical protein